MAAVNNRSWKLNVVRKCDTEWRGVWPALKASGLWFSGPKRNRWNRPRQYEKLLWECWECNDLLGLCAACLTLQLYFPCLLLLLLSGVPLKTRTPLDHVGTTPMIAEIRGIAQRKASRPALLHEIPLLCSDSGSLVKPAKLSIAVNLSRAFQYFCTKGSISVQKAPLNLEVDLLPTRRPALN